MDDRHMIHDSAAEVDYRSEPRRFWYEADSRHAQRSLQSERLFILKDGQISTSTTLIGDAHLIQLFKQVQLKLPEVRSRCIRPIIDCVIDGLVSRSRRLGDIERVLGGVITVS